MVNTGFFLLMLAFTGPAFARRPGVYESVNTTERVIALTFDDGPHPVLTPKLLNILRKEKISATFYVIGNLVEKYPEIARRIVREKHEIAHHSWSHPHLTTLNVKKLNDELVKTVQIIKRVTGVSPKTMRPPYGDINSQVRKSVLDLGLDVALWSVDPKDWERPGAHLVRQRLVKGAKPGGILLAHDIHPGTIEAMPGTVRDLKKKGFRFATVTKLINSSKTGAKIA